MGEKEERYLYNLASSFTYTLSKLFETAEHRMNTVELITSHSIFIKLESELYNQINKRIRDGKTK